MSRIGLILMTPKSTGGAETALRLTAEGFRMLSYETDVLAVSSKKGLEWSPQSKTFVNVVMPNNYDEIETMLMKYDGLVLSDTYFGSGSTLVDVLTKSTKIPKWVSARHWNSVAPTVYERHAIVKDSPAWCGSYVSFWPSVEDAFPEVEWHRGILPYQLNPLLQNVYPVSERPFQFLHAGRTDPQKGVVTFVSALERLSRIDTRAWSARIAGVPGEMPGGPHIAKIADMLENWGWTIERDIPRGESKWMKSNWKAHKDGHAIVHTGAFAPADLPEIFGSAQVYINSTSWKFAPEHLEYMTMEALDSGIMVVAPTDWPAYHYNGRPPIVTEHPVESYKIQKGNRIVYNNFDPTAPDTTYDPLAQRLVQALNFLDKGRDTIDSVTAQITDHNRGVLMESHNPTRAADAYIAALGLQG